MHRFASLGLKSGIAARFAPDLTSLLHRFASLILKSRIDARIALVLTSLLHRFASLGLKSRIDARFAPVLTFWLHRFASLGLKSGIAAAPSLRQRRTARLQRSRGVQAGTGCHEGGIILSKKPPEWRLTPPDQRSASDSILLCGIVEQPACSKVVGAGGLHTSGISQAVCR